MFALERTDAARHDGGRRRRGPRARRGEASSHVALRRAVWTLAARRSSSCVVETSTCTCPGTRARPRGSRGPSHRHEPRSVRVGSSAVTATCRAPALRAVEHARADRDEPTAARGSARRRRTSRRCATGRVTPRAADCPSASRTTGTGCSTGWARARSPGSRRSRTACYRRAGSRAEVARDGGLDVTGTADPVGRRARVRHRPRARARSAATRCSRRAPRDPRPRHLERLGARRARRARPAGQRRRRAQDGARSSSSSTATASRRRRRSSTARCPACRRARARALRALAEAVAGGLRARPAARPSPRPARRCSRCPASAPGRSSTSRCARCATRRLAGEATCWLARGRPAAAPTRSAGGRGAPTRRWCSGRRDRCTLTARAYRCANHPLSRSR